MVDYSVWDHIEVSDDEDETHPNIDTASLFRWRHQVRPAAVVPPPPPPPFPAANLRPGPGFPGNSRSHGDRPRHPHGKGGGGSRCHGNQLQGPPWGGFLFS